MTCAYIGSGERDGVPSVEDAELDEGSPSQSSGRSMSIEGVVDVQDGEGLLPGRKNSFQVRGRGQMKIRLTKETALLGKLKGPRSRYVTNPYCN